MVVRGQVRSSKTTVFATRYTFPTAICQEAMVRADNELRSVLQFDSICRLDATPMIEYRSLHIAAISADSLRSIDLVSDLDFGERFRSPVAHQDRCVTTGAVRARMETSSIGVDGEAEPDIGTIVFRDDRAGFFFEDFQLSCRRFSEPLGVDRVPWVRRVGNGTHEGTLAEA